ncbi:MAG: amino acid decarboxylase, partial [Nocardioidaceae bacterium]|nr:amino acid decarboxylase [Nocardioidaceae bacterium]
QWPGALGATWSTDAPPLQPTVFPVADLQARPELRAGARVLVRGAALTAIDALLALTLGRGQEPATPDLQLVLASRTGRPMMPKTPADVLRPLVERAGDLADVRTRIAAGADVPAQLRVLAARLLGDGPQSQEEVACAESRLGGDGSDEDPVAVLRRGVEVASGVRRPDGAWALGQAWRLLYRDLVERQRRTPSSCPPLDWPGFSTCAPELERLAFGPPLVNARHLLDALTGAQVTMVRGGLEVVGRQEADLVVDAVLPPPGIVDLADDHVLGRLRDQGVLSHGEGRRGARIDADATVIDACGNRVLGLALVGRATEDEVLGNDTLDRTMHPHVDRWAQRVASSEAARP